MRALEEEQISHWRDQFEADGIPPLVTIDPNERLVYRIDRFIDPIDRSSPLFQPLSSRSSALRVEGASAAGDGQEHGQH